MVRPPLAAVVETRALLLGQTGPAPLARSACRHGDHYRSPFLGRLQRNTTKPDETPLAFFSRPSHTRLGIYMPNHSPSPSASGLAQAPGISATHAPRGAATWGGLPPSLSGPLIHKRHTRICMRMMHCNMSLHNFVSMTHRVQPSVLAGMASPSLRSAHHHQPSLQCSFTPRTLVAQHC